MADNDVDALSGDAVYETGTQDEGADNLDPIENLTGDDPDEIMQTSYVPPHREPHNLRNAPTPFEEAQGESLDQKLAEEEPDITVDDVAFEDVEPRAGRLLAPSEGGLADREADAIAEDVGPAGYAASAEEAAMHIIPDVDVSFD